MVAVKKVNNFADLQKELNKMILSAMKDIGRDAQDTVKTRVQEDVYDAAKPKYYKRTLQLKKSVSKDIYQVGNFTQAKIFHDPNLMEAIAPSYDNNRMGQHHTTSAKYNPKDFRLYVANAVNDGTSGLIFGEGYWTKPRPYFTHAKAEVESRFLRNLKYGLIFRGLTIR